MAIFRQLTAWVWLFAALLSHVSIAQERDEDLPPDDLDVEEDDLSVDQLRGLHKLMDGDGDGRLSLDEVLAFSQKSGYAIASKDVHAILEEIDLSKDGKLSLDEHLKDIDTQAEGGDEEEMRELAARKEIEKMKFHAADANKDGVLDAGELTFLFYPETHDGVLDITVAETFKAKDKNSDGQLSVHEFWEAYDDAAEGDIAEEEKEDFTKLDTDHNGFLNMDEVRAWESGRFHTVESMQKLFDVADQNSDMHLTADEFVGQKEAIALSDAQYHLIEWAEHHEL